MTGKKAALVFTDPPYNVPMDGHAGGLGKTHHADFAMASGEMNVGGIHRFSSPFARSGCLQFSSVDRFISFAWIGGISASCSLRAMRCTAS